MARRLIAALLVALGVLAVATPAGAGPNDPLPVPYDFLPAAIIGGANQLDGPPGSNDWTCKPSAAHPNPVVLVHGTLGNGNTNWQTYGPLLHNNGYCVFALTYGLIPHAQLPLSLFGGIAPIEGAAVELAAFIARVLAATGAAKVDILGHSQGTVMPDYYARFLGGATLIDRYISLAPLWHGTNPLGLGALQKLGMPAGAETAAPTTALTEMNTGSAFITKLRSGAGPKVPGITYTNIMTRYDELVQPYTSGIEVGMTNIVVQDKCPVDFTEHFEIASDPVAAGYVLNALDPAHPRPVPCRLVLPWVGTTP